MTRQWSRRYRGRHRSWCVRTLIRRDGAVCAICADSFARMQDITLDHIIPRSLGGGDEIENLQLAHEPCNRAKNDLSPEEWEALQDPGAAVV
jgi:5-methylcytosine-specific restriction endonuclease McrA